MKHPCSEQLPAETEEVSKFLPSPSNVFVERFTPWTTSAPSSVPGASVAMVTSLGKSYGESAGVFLALDNEILTAGNKGESQPGCCRFMERCLGPAPWQCWQGQLVHLGRVLRPVAYTTGAVWDSAHECIRGERIAITKS